MNRKGAIELSASFIVIMVISSVIVVGGLGLFFKLKNIAQQYVSTIDSQTESKIKSIMLNNNYRVAVYPQDPVINPNDAVMIGIGITNINPDVKTFEVKLASVKYYAKDDVTGSLVASNANPTDLLKYYEISGSTISIAANTQAVKGMLLKMPEGKPKGQYVYTITTKIVGDINNYGVVQVYATN